MNVLIIGSGGREHALCYAVNKSEYSGAIYAIPGNPGMAELATCINVDPMDNDAVKKIALENNINLIIPGSEVYLENGIKDTFDNTDIYVFGPSKRAALIESSKKYAKDLMKKHEIPSAEYAVFDDYGEAEAYVLNGKIPIVIKYNGLAGGKGVVVAMNQSEALDALELMLKDRIYGSSNIVIEEYLEGPEFSFMAFVHKERVISMPISQDHKRLLNGDHGPNTGGMGIYSPVPIIPTEIIDDAYQNIMVKTARAMVKEDNFFTGFLYGGLMLTNEGPKVIEFNARFGDPEAEVILPKLETDILDIIFSLFNDKEIDIKWSDEYYVGVVMASKGYPKNYTKGHAIKGLEDVDDLLFQMGTKLVDGELQTNGGRVLLVTGKGTTLTDAKTNAYKNVNKIKCTNLIYRTDIGYRSL